MPVLASVFSTAKSQDKLARNQDVYLPRSTKDVRLAQYAATSAGMRTVCGNPKCSKGWISFLKDRRRPMFEGRWSCTAECTEVLVDAAIRRELIEPDIAGNGGEHQHRVPLGLILLSQGRITQPQLQHALHMQRSAGTGRIGQWLIGECGLDEEHVTHGLGVQWRCPVLSAEGFNPAAMSLVIPKVLVENVGMVPLRIAGGRILYLGFESQLDAAAAFAMKRMSGLTVESGLLDPTTLRAARETLSKCDFVACTFERVVSVETLSSKVAFALSETQPRASRLVRVHQFYWLRMWLERGAMSSEYGSIPATKEDVMDRVYSLGTGQ